MKTTLTMLKRKRQVMLAFSFFFVLMLSADALYAQSPVIHQYYMKLEESPKMIDPSYCVIECTTGKPEIFIQLFNENPTDQTLDFKLKITDVSGDVTYYTVSDFELTAAAMVQPECGISAYSDLRISVPSGYDPAGLTVEISYP